jgi:hypothetical protein
MRSDKGWAPFLRRWVFGDGLLARCPKCRAVFLVAYAAARWKENDPDDTTTIPRGSLRTSVGELSRRTGISTRGIRTVLTRLQNAKLIDTRTDNVGTLVSVVNYDVYQNPQRDDESDSTNETTSDRQAIDKGPTTYENNGTTKQEISLEVDRVGAASRKAQKELGLDARSGPMDERDEFDLESLPFDADALECFPPPEPKNKGANQRKRGGLGPTIGNESQSNNGAISSSKKRAGKRLDKPVPVTTESWGAYQAGYTQRYGSDPIRSAAMSSSLKRIVEAVGAADAVSLVKFYTECGDPFLVSQRHPIYLLERNINGYLDRWRKGEREQGRGGANGVKQGSVGTNGDSVRVELWGKINGGEFAHVGNLEAQKAHVQRLYAAELAGGVL